MQYILQTAYIRIHSQGNQSIVSHSPYRETLLCKPYLQEVLPQLYTEEDDVMLCFVQLRKALLGLNCLVNLEQCTTVMLYTLNNLPTLPYQAW